MPSVRVVNEKERERRAPGGAWGGGSPSPVGEGSEEGALSPPHNFFFDFFCLAMVHFGAFWALVLMLV